MGASARNAELTTGMPLAILSLGEVLSRIYDFPFESAVYLPRVARYEADTPCMIAGDRAELVARHYGFVDWLNVAVVSDTCDQAPDKSPTKLVATFNDDCQEGHWLARMMNYRNPSHSPGP
jgi:hypothetical protein